MNNFFCCIKIKSAFCVYIIDGKIINININVQQDTGIIEENIEIEENRKVSTMPASSLSCQSTFSAQKCSNDAGEDDENSNNDVEDDEDDNDDNDGDDGQDYEYPRGIGDIYIILINFFLIKNQKKFF